MHALVLSLWVKLVEHSTTDRDIEGWNKLLWRVWLVAILLLEKYFRPDHDIEGLN
jgi:hypothetical protein